MDSHKTPILQVAAKAVIVDTSGDVLILREATTGKNNTQIGYWGLVGGRVEPGETFIDGLKREVREETGLTVQVSYPLYVGEWHPSIRGTLYQIIAVFMLCRTDNKKVQLSVEHDRYVWIDPATRSEYAMMDPDDLVIDELVKRPDKADH